MNVKQGLRRLGLVFGLVGAVWLAPQGWEKTQGQRWNYEEQQRFLEYASSNSLLIQLSKLSLDELSVRSSKGFWPFGSPGYYTYGTRRQRFDESDRDHIRYVDFDLDDGRIYQIEFANGESLRSFHRPLPGPLELYAPHLQRGALGLFTPIVLCFLLAWAYEGFASK